MRNLKRDRMLWCAKGKKGRRKLDQCSWTKDGAKLYAQRMRKEGYKNVRVVKVKVGRDND